MREKMKMASNSPPLSGSRAYASDSCQIRTIMTWNLISLILYRNLLGKWKPELITFCTEQTISAEFQFD